MAEKYISIGGFEDIIIYDDSEMPFAIETDGGISVGDIGSGQLTSLSARVTSVEILAQSLEARLDDIDIIIADFETRIQALENP